MDLSTKFKVTSSYRAFGVSSLKMYIPYSIERVEKIQTRYGETISLTLKESTKTFVKVFLPKRYGDPFTDDDIKSINEKCNLFSQVQWHYI
jgi:hypothetical protein